MGFLAVDRPVLLSLVETARAQGLARISNRRGGRRLVLYALSVHCGFHACHGCRLKKERLMDAALYIGAGIGLVGAVIGAAASILGTYLSKGSKTAATGCGWQLTLHFKTTSRTWSLRDSCLEVALSRP